MKIELNLDDNKYIELITELNELEDRYKEISEMYNEVSSTIDNNNYEFNTINNEIIDNSNKINKMIEDVKIKSVTIKNIITDEVVLISMIALYFGIQLNDSMFALYGFSAFTGVSLISAKIMGKNEDKKKKKVIKSEDYCQLKRKIKELTNEKEKRNIINNKLKLQFSDLKNEKENIECEIENKRQEIVLFLNNIYNDVNNVLDETTETYGLVNCKTRIRNIKEDKRKE